MTAVAVALAALMCGVAGSIAADAPKSPAVSLHEAMASLQRGQYDLAEKQALSVAGDSQKPNARAWVVVASARQGAGKMADALKAYQLYVAAYPAAAKGWVGEQMRLCAEPVREAAVPPSKKLTEEQLADFAKADETLYVETSPHFVVRAHNSQLAKYMVGQGEEVLKRASTFIMGTETFKQSVEINIWLDREDYVAHAVDSSDWAGGCYSFSMVDGVMKRRIDLTQRDGAGKFSTLMLDRILPHEMSHMVLGEYFGDATCPLFLNEGMAMLLEGDADQDRLVLCGTAMAGKGKIALDSLVAMDRSAIEDPSVFYAESYSFLTYVQSRLSEKQFRAFLGNVRGGSTVAEALERALFARPDHEFLARLAGAWEDQAITQSQYIRALRGETDLLTADKN